MANLKISGKAETIAYVKAGIGTILIAIISGLNDPLMEWLILDSGYSITWIAFCSKVYAAVAMVVTFWVIKILGTMNKADIDEVKNAVEETNTMTQEMTKINQDDETISLVKQREQDLNDLNSGKEPTVLIQRDKKLYNIPKSQVLPTDKIITVESELPPEPIPDPLNLNSDSNTTAGQ